MRRTLIALVPLLLGTSAVWAFDEPPKAAAQGASEKYRALLKDYEKAQQDFSEAYTKATTDAERQKIVQDKYPRPERFAGQFLELAEAHPHDAVALDSLVWICTFASGSREEGKALDLLLRDHIASDKLAPVCSRLVYSNASEAEAFLRGVLAKNPSHDVQGQACLALAQYLRRREEQTPPVLSGLKGLFTKKPAAEASKDPRKEAEALFERVIKDFGDVKGFRGTLADNAKNELYEIRFLSVGKEAPDIAGEDIGGNEFKLSDYRGKVVVLDFWGNW